MKRILLLLVSAAFVLTPIQTFAKTIHKQSNYRHIFLNFVPPNEPGAPHNMEWIIEHDVGDGGYYGTKYFPGTMTVTAIKSHYYSMDISHQSVYDGFDTQSIHWKIDGVDIWFELFKNAKRETFAGGYTLVPGRGYDISPLNSAAFGVVNHIYSSSSNS